MPELPDTAIALFLDFDGTLVEIAHRPEAIRVDAALPALLEAAARRLDGALAILTGRPIAGIDALLAPARFAAAGVHGLEVRAAPDQPVTAGATAHALDAVRAALAAAGLTVGAHAGRDSAGDGPPGGARAPAGVLVEDKRLAIAVHYRDAPACGDAVRALVAAAAAPFPELHVVTGKMVVEVKPRGVDKGTALMNFLARPPFQHRCPVMIGDDVTDEDAFRAALAAGGRAIKVGDGASLAPRRLADVPAVHAFVATLAG